MRIRRQATGCLLFLAAAWLCATADAAARPATVEGAPRVFLRRGHGLEFQAFATVEEGERVEVEEVTGSWALVRTGGGYQGYMHAAFLVYPDGTRAIGKPPKASPTPAGVAVAVPTPTATAASEESASVAAQVENLQREFRQLRGERAGGAAVTAEDIVALRAEVRRLADTTDALRSRLDAPGGVAPSGLPLGAGERWSTTSLVVASAVALAMGWLIGGAAARREDRSRRTRIRF